MPGAGSEQSIAGVVLASVTWPWPPPIVTKRVSSGSVETKVTVTLMLPGSAVKTWQEVSPLVQPLSMLPSVTFHWASKFRSGAAVRSAALKPKTVVIVPSQVACARRGVRTVDRRAWCWPR